VTPLVLKLGGSLAESGRLTSRLALVRRARRPVVVVPGGGLFADAVRAAQAATGFSDAVAHDMALLAMHQMAAVFCDLEPRLAPAETLESMAAAWRRRRVPVWMPMRLSAGDRRIPRDWSITSDGLAARLAERLCGAEVVLVKSCAVRASASAATLARQGVVDAVFPQIVARAGLRWRVLGAGDDARLAALLDAGQGRARSTLRSGRATAVASR
jgi:aspartokinase-like uncharacterized kinase